MAERLFHIAEPDAWARAAGEGAYRPASLAREGFIHLSFERQVLATANRFFAGRGELLLLEVDAASLGVALRLEEGEPGELFPHLYGPLPFAAVRRVHRLRPSAGGIYQSLSD